MPTKTLNERERRKPTWRPGAWIELGDRGRWALPEVRPCLRLVPTSEAGILLVPAFKVNGVPSEEYFELQNECDAGEESGEALFVLVTFAFQSNYFISMDELHEMLLPTRSIPETLATFDRIVVELLNKPALGALRLVQGLPALRDGRFVGTERN